MKRPLLGLGVVLFLILHQDFWNWTAPRPLFLGMLPVGLFYHVCYTLAAALLMWLLVKVAWPAHLEDLDDNPR
jgi:hypothetical protein